MSSAGSVENRMSIAAMYGSGRSGGGVAAGLARLSTGGLASVSSGLLGLGVGDDELGPAGTPVDEAIRSAADRPLAERIRRQVDRRDAVEQVSRRDRLGREDEEAADRVGEHEPDRAGIEGRDGDVAP